MTFYIVETPLQLHATYYFLNMLIHTVYGTTILELLKWLKHASKKYSKNLMLKSWWRNKCFALKGREQPIDEHKIVGCFKSNYPPSITNMIPLVRNMKMLGRVSNWHFCN